MNKFREQKVEIRPIDNLNKNFICGMDGSEGLAEEKRGGIYYDYEVMSRIYLRHFQNLV